jgi:hypothetical protein
MSCISTVFDTPLVSSSTTWKGLGINFGGDSPDPGAFAKKPRFCLVEEFFKMTMQDKDHPVEFGTMNSLLEHTMTGASSGKFNNSELQVVPKATMMWVTNYMTHKPRNFAELPQCMESSF